MKSQLLKEGVSQGRFTFTLGITYIAFFYGVIRVLQKISEKGQKLITLIHDSN
jgi:hypothetical protein